MILIRFALISLIAYLIIRSFVRYTEEEKKVAGGAGPKETSTHENKKVSKEIGEYIDYEEVKKQ